MAVFCSHLSFAKRRQIDATVRLFFRRRFVGPRFAHDLVITPHNERRTRCLANPPPSRRTPPPPAPTEPGRHSGADGRSSRRKKLFDAFEKAQKDDLDAKTTLVRRACEELTVHAMIEEELLYPAAQEALDEDDRPDVEEAYVEHFLVKVLIDKFTTLKSGRQRASTRRSRS